MRGDSPRARVWWSLGCLACLAHIALAMHVYHHWSNAAAIAETARQTVAAVGLNFGGGVYFNYLFAALWSADVLWWWIAPRSRETRPRVLSTALHIFLVFIVLNATVVFETGLIRWASLAVGLILALLWLRKPPSLNKPLAA